MVAKEYCQLVKDATGFCGAYPLEVPVRVGDYFEVNKEGVLVLQGNVFVDDSVWDTGVPRVSEPIQGSPSYFAACDKTVTSDDGVKVEVPGAVGIDASVSMKFTSKAGFALAYESAVRERVRELPSVHRALVQKVRDHSWREEWILVTEVIKAASSTLIVAEESGSEISLHAKVDVPAAELAGLSIADPELGWTSSGWKGSGYSTVCKAGSTPLFHTLQVKKGWFGRIKTETLGDDDFTKAFAEDVPFGED